MSSQVKIIILVLGLSLLAVFGVAVLLSRMEQRGVDPSVVIGDERFATGSAQPKVTIVEFSDFQCPACREITPVVKRIVAENSSQVRLVYRQFPITSAHGNAFDAALAAEIAGEQGKFWEMHDLLFERQDEWAAAKDVRTLFYSYAEELGMDRQAFSDAWDSEQYAQRIKNDMRDAKTLGILSTPTVFVEGKLVSKESLSETVADLLSQ